MERRRKLSTLADGCQSKDAVREAGKSTSHKDEALWGAPRDGSEGIEAVLPGKVSKES